jgi:hypothetical protein
MADPDTRRAARIAAFVAVPVAVVAGLVAFQVMSPDEPAGPGTAAASPRPVPSTPVPMSAPPLSERTATVCRALFAKLPDRFGDLARRPVAAGPEQNAAYGEPPVTLSCGVQGPTPPDGAQYFEVNGVCWYTEDVTGDRRWSLQGREVPLVVTVPAAYDGEDLVDLSKPVSEAIAEVKQVCKG